MKRPSFAVISRYILEYKIVSKFTKHKPKLDRVGHVDNRLFTD